MVLTIDEARWLLRAGEETILLPTNAFRLVAYLARNPGIVRSREQIMDAAGVSLDSFDYAAPSYIKRIRQKFRPFGVDPIRTVYGVGYSWKEEVKCNFC